MNADSFRSRRSLTLWGIFLLGFLAGEILWGRIRLPLSNPWDIHGPLVQQGINPADAIVSFGLLLGLPLAGLLAAFLAGLRNVGLAQLLFTERPVERRFSLNRPALSRLTGLLLLGCVLVLGLHSGPASKTLLMDTFHEGETLGPAVGYLAGQSPYKDMVFVHGIIQDPVRSVVAFKLFGQNVWGTRVLDSCTYFAALSLYTLFFWLALRGKPVLAALAALFLSCGPLLYLLRPTTASLLSVPPRDIVTWGYFCTLPFLARQLQEGPPDQGPMQFRFWNVLNGFLPLFGFSYSIDRGFYLTATWLVMNALSYAAVHHNSPKRGDFLLSQGLGALLAVLVFLLLCRDGVSEFLSFTFSIMPRYKELMDGFQTEPLRFRFLFACLALGGSLYWLAHQALTLLRSGAFKGRAVLRLFLQRYFLETALLLAAVFFFRSALGRSDAGHVGYSAAPAYALFLLILLRHCLPGALHRWAASPGATRATVGALALLLCVTTWLTPHERVTRSFPVGQPDEQVIPETYKPVITFLKENLKENESFVTLTSEASWYYFLNKPCPIRFPVVWFAMPPFYQQEIVRDLRKNGRIKYVLRNSPMWTNRIDNIENDTRLPLVMRAVDELYIFDRMLNGHEIWVRRDVASPEAPGGQARRKGGSA